MNRQQTVRWVLCGVGAMWLGGAVATTQSNPKVPPPFVAKNLEDMKPAEGASNVVIFGDPSNMIAMKPGSFVFHPAFGHHYDMAKDEEAVVRIVGMGPVKTTNIDQPK